MSKPTYSVCLVNIPSTFKEIWKRDTFTRYGRVDTCWLILTTEISLNDKEERKKKIYKSTSTKRKEIRISMFFRSRWMSGNQTSKLNGKNQDINFYL